MKSARPLLPAGSHLLTCVRAGKHWKCSECNKKLHSANGMAIHMYQVHKIDVKT